MTNAELNLAIAKLVYPECEDFWQKYDEAKVRVNWEDDMGFIHTGKIADYCNNWNDLMPLVVEHGISLVFDEVYENWRAVFESDAPNFYWVEAGQNPQRALAECLLKVLQEKDND